MEVASLGTVAEYITSARVLLQDAITPYRYADDELVLALNFALMEARRLRPDLFLEYFHERAAFPEFDTDDTTEEVDIDVQYRSAILYYIVGHAQLRDDEPTQDSRAMAFLGKFAQQLATLA
jgi:hypothetical protein